MPANKKVISVKYWVEFSRAEPEQDLHVGDLLREVCVSGKGLTQQMERPGKEGLKLSLALTRA